MFASLAALALAVQPAPRPRRVARDAAALAEACRGKDGWTDPAPPAHIFGNTYYVGTCGISAILITDERGHVLIDGGPPEAAPLILANIRRLGVDPRRIRYLLNSHEHFDHAGGLAALKQATGAQLFARVEARATLESGRPDPADPQGAVLHAFPPVRVDQVLASSGVVVVGTVALPGVVLTYDPTPGHTAGSTTWSWTACERWTGCRFIAYADSLTSPAAEHYRFTDHPALVASFRATFAVVAAQGCDILITPHPSASNLFARLAGRAPLIDPTACRAYADSASARLNQRLAQERAGR